MFVEAIARGKIELTEFRLLTRTWIPRLPVIGFRQNVNDVIVVKESQLGKFGIFVQYFFTIRSKFWIAAFIPSAAPIPFFQIMAGLNRIGVKASGGTRLVIVLGDDAAEVFFVPEGAISEPPVIAIQVLNRTVSLPRVGKIAEGDGRVPSLQRDRLRMFLPDLPGRIPHIIFPRAHVPTRIESRDEEAGYCRFFLIGLLGLSLPLSPRSGGVVRIRSVPQ